MRIITKEEIKDLSRKGKKILKKAHVKENPAEKWYKYKNILIQAFNYFVISLCRIIPPCGIKNSLYRLIGVKIGKNVAIGVDFNLDTLFPELVVIEDNVIIGWGVIIRTHEFVQDSYRIGSVIIKENSTIGGWSLIRPGIIINENSIVGAMAFVNKDVPKNTVVGGIPIKKIRSIRRP